MGSEQLLENLKYVIRYPEDFSERKKYPLVIYLHGAGGRGADISIIQNHSFFHETEKYNFNAVFMAPQCYEDSWFSIFEQLQKFAVYAKSLDYVDKERIYLIGASMGGYATWQLAMSKPDIFAAIVPICGGGMYWNAGRLKNMGVWAFHGECDPIVYCEESKKMVQAVNNNGGHAKLTVYSGIDHNAWLPTFNNEGMWAWLWTQKCNYVEEASLYNDVGKFG